MSQDIAKYVDQVVSKLTGNNSLIEQFKKNPVKIVTDILGIKLDDQLIQAVIKAVQGKLSIEDVAKNAGGILGKLKSLFGKYAHQNRAGMNSLPSLYSEIVSVQPMNFQGYFRSLCTLVFPLILSSNKTNKKRIHQVTLSSRPKRSESEAEWRDL